MDELEYTTSMSKITPPVDEDLNEAHRALISLLKKCEVVLEKSTLSPSRQTLMRRRVEALSIAVRLIEEKRKQNEV